MKHVINILYFCFISEERSHTPDNFHEVQGSKIQIVFKNYIFVIGKGND